MGTFIPLLARVLGNVEVTSCDLLAVWVSVYIDPKSKHFAGERVMRTIVTHSKSVRANLLGGVSSLSQLLDWADPWRRHPGI